MVRGQPGPTRRVTTGLVALEGPRAHRGGLPGGRPLARVRRSRRRGGSAGLPALGRSGARSPLPRRHRALPPALPGSAAALPVPVLQPGRELLGDRLRDARLHPARAEGHPLPLDPDLVLPPRAGPLLVGQLGLRRLRHRKLVRGPDRLSRRPPLRRAARRGRPLPTHHAPEVRRLRGLRERPAAGRLPQPAQRGQRGGRVRQEPDGLSHAAPLGRGRGLLSRAAPVLERAPLPARLVVGPRRRLHRRDRYRLAPVRRRLDHADRRAAARDRRSLRPPRPRRARTVAGRGGPAP